MHYKFENIHFTNRRTADKVLTEMKDIAELYGVVTVADLYDLAEIKGTSYSDDKYGWVSSQFKNALIQKKTSCDYIITLPNPFPIDPEKPMTYREKLQKEHPECVSDRYMGGCKNCPGTYGYGPERGGNEYCSGKCVECWNKEYKEYKGEKEMATVNSFKKEDIKAGYVIRLRKGEYRMIYPVGKEGTLIAINSSGTWSYISQWNSDLDYTGRTDDDQKYMDITEVYGYITGMSNYHLLLGATLIHARPRLWKRTEAKKMTVAEINAALGYEVEIVAEKEE